MKTKIMSLTIVLFLLGSFSLLSQETKTEKFKVHGNCGMCEKRIEKAAGSVEGVTFADWNAETKVIEVKYNPSETDLNTVHLAIAKVGHDTDLKKADDKTYTCLPKCCQYERK